MSSCMIPRFTDISVTSTMTYEWANYQMLAGGNAIARFCLTFVKLVNLGWPNELGAEPAT